MSHLIPRQPSHQAHRRTHSNNQAPDKRVAVVTKLENCIEEVLEATRSYKSPQQHSAHQNANQMFQERIMASAAHMGGMSEQDWLGTMMQCLNESMRVQQSSFVRNTSLDIALKAFVGGIFDALGPAYFKETLDKYLAGSRHNVSGDGNPGHTVHRHTGIPSPPREMAPSQAASQRQRPQQIMPPASHIPPHHPIHRAMAPVQQSGASSRQTAPPATPQHQAMPSSYRHLPASQSRNHATQRPPSTTTTNVPVRQRAYASEALRQAAGTTAPPPPAQAQAGPSQAAGTMAPPPHHQAQAGPSQVHNLSSSPRISFESVYEETDVRRRQAILGYEGKWYVFQCRQHETPIFCKTAEGARHHLVSEHAQPHQHIDLFDMIRELGVEVVNCDAKRAEMNNFDAAIMWNQMRKEPLPRAHRQPGTLAQPAATTNHVSTSTIVQRRPSPVEIPPPEISQATKNSVKMDSPSIVFLSDDELAEATLPSGKVKVKCEEEKPESNGCDATSESPNSTTQASTSEVELMKLAAKAISLDSTRTVPDSADDQHTASQFCAAAESERVKNDTSSKESTAETEAPGMIPDSPQSSELSEPPPIEELEAFKPEEPKKTAKPDDGELEEGEIDESCITVAVRPLKRGCDSVSSPKKKRRISAAGSVSPKERKKLPSTPQSSKKKSKGRASFWTPLKETGPSAHDQFKTKACKKCSERFYFRAQLATHMQSEHPEVVMLE